MRLALPLLLLTCLVDALRAEEPFSFATTPGQLPKDIVPQHYAISLTPQLESNTFSGSETIDLEVRTETNMVVLNSAGLEITHAEIDGKAVATQLEEEKQTLTVKTPDSLRIGRHQLALSFHGKLTEQPFGLYIARYQNGTAKGQALATQMEAADARRMFPCWDEPVFRATYALSVTAPESWEVVSNMPINTSTPAAAGAKTVTFAKTPPMATYLVALFAGEFEWLEDEIDGVKLRVLTTPGKKEQARYALEATKQILPYYNSYFGVPYPLPKLDQIALPSTGASGMENWGAIAYNDAAFLYNRAVSAQSTRERVFEVVAHEIAHQWFGDLVTMAWWNNLWLNEGFASWMGTKATDHFNPEWQVWLRSGGDKEWAMSLDARSTTHPIQQPVKTVAQAMDAFDVITYQKGEAFLRMLETYLGETSFQGGIQEYVKRHAYSSATTANLWQALEDVSGKPVRTIAASWTEQPSFPVVKFTKVAGKDEVSVSQERFTLNQPHPEPLYWAVPVTYGPAGAPLAAQTMLLKAVRPETLPIDSGAALKANIGDVGYYRVWYDNELFKRLEKTILMMAAADRLNLLNDAWSMAAAGRAPIARYLRLVDAMAGDENFAVLNSTISTLAFIDELERHQAGQKSFRSWACHYLAPHLARLGWDAKPDEKPLDPLLRSRVIGMLGGFGDEAVLIEARRRFDAFLLKPETLTGDLRATVFSLIGRQADANLWEKLHALAKAEDSTELKRVYYRALSATRSPQLARSTLALSLTDELSPRQALGLLYGVGNTGEQPEVALTFALANLDALTAKASALERNGFGPSLFSPFSDVKRAEELEKLGRTQFPPESGPQVAKVADEIRFKASLKKALLPDIDAWCRKHTGK